MKDFEKEITETLEKIAKDEKAYNALKETLTILAPFHPYIRIALVVVSLLGGLQKTLATEQNNG